ncbi:MAG: hypothetical protein ACTS73_05730 [Arsenophonus sp. NEOnobi-MAG3]
MKKQIVIQIKETLSSLPTNIKLCILLVSSATICRMMLIHALKQLISFSYLYCYSEDIICCGDS